MGKSSSPDHDAAIPEFFEWTLNQVTRSATECFSAVIDNRIQIYGVQYNTGQNNHLVRLNVPDRAVGEVNIVKFGPGPDDAKGTRYNGSGVSEFIAGYIGYTVDADKRIDGVFSGILDFVFPPLIVGILNVENDPASAELLPSILKKHAHGWADPPTDAVAGKSGTCVITGSQGGLIHTLDVKARFVDAWWTLVFTFPNGKGPLKGAVETVTFKINGAGVPADRHFALPCDNATFEYRLNGQATSGHGQIEELVYHPENSGWSGQFTFNAQSRSFRGFFTV
jgi:hypothetical protein